MASDIIHTWHELAQQLRVDSIRATTAAGSGHPTSSMSAADLLAVLFSSYLRYDFSNPDDPNSDHFILSKVIRASDQDQVALVAAGITVHEALKAYDRLKREGITVRVIDAYSVKPIDVKTLHQVAHDTDGNFVIAEDPWAEGGLGDAVLDAFAGKRGAPIYGEANLTLVKLAVREMSDSGTRKRCCIPPKLMQTRSQRLCGRSCHKLHGCQLNRAYPQVGNAPEPTPSAKVFYLN